MCDRNFVHLKLESIVSKWYGESEKKMAKVLTYYLHHVMSFNLELDRLHRHACAMITIAGIRFV